MQRSAGSRLLTFLLDGVGRRQSGASFEANAPAALQRGLPVVVAPYAGSRRATPSATPSQNWRFAHRRLRRAFGSRGPTCRRNRPVSTGGAQQLRYPASRMQVTGPPGQHDGTAATWRRLDCPTRMGLRMRQARRPRAGPRGACTVHPRSSSGHAARARSRNRRGDAGPRATVSRQIRFACRPRAQVRPVRLPHGARLDLGVGQHRAEQAGPGRIVEWQPPAIHHLLAPKAARRHRTDQREDQRWVPQQAQVEHAPGGAGWQCRTATSGRARCDDQGHQAHAHAVDGTRGLPVRSPRAPGQRRPRRPERSLGLGGTGMTVRGP